MNFIKARWKEILIALLLIMSMRLCSSSGNYERKYKQQLAYTEYTIDSMKTVYSNSAKHIDSLNKVIRFYEIEIASLENQLEIYKSQNEQLNATNKSLADKKVVVNIEKTKEQ